MLLRQILDLAGVVRYRQITVEQVMRVALAALGESLYWSTNHFLVTKNNNEIIKWSQVIRLFSLK
jgi:hypothetical protein